jgi:hypothetical protein
LKHVRKDLEGTWEPLRLVVDVPMFQDMYTTARIVAREQLRKSECLLKRTLGVSANDKECQGRITT